MLITTMTWTPIATAPKERWGKYGERTEFLAVREGSKKVVIGWWEDDRYAKKPRPYWAGTDMGKGMAYMRQTPFEKWMPLPDADS